MRKVKLRSGFVYHIYNRGVEKRKIFLDAGYYRRFISTLEHYLSYDYPYSLLWRRLQDVKSPDGKREILEQLERKRIDQPVNIISFCLMPNHFHLTLKQAVENGISNYMHKIGTSYTNYFNIREDRSGRLFEGTFKAVRVESDEQLRHLTRYQHINSWKIVKNKRELRNYPWSSLPIYLGKKDMQFVNPELVMGNFKDSEDYLDFVLAEVDEDSVSQLAKVAIDDDFGWFEEWKAREKSRKEESREYLYRSID